MTRPSQRVSTPTERSRRPKDRADQIIAEASRLFRERGFHDVGIDDIGAAVGITGPAVYRHFESKVDLLVAAVVRSTDRMHTLLTTSLEGADTAEERLNRLLRCGVQLTAEDPDLSAVFMREGRHLPASPPKETVAKQRESAELYFDALSELCPNLSQTRAQFLLQTVTGIDSSVLYYRSTPSRSRREGLLAAMGYAALMAGAAVEPTSASLGNGAKRWNGDRVASRVPRRESVLAAAVKLFSEHGYSGVGIDDIGLASGITGPGVYRHFKSKEDLLSAAFTRANELMNAMVAQSVAGAASAEEALSRLLDAYVDFVIANPELVTVYMTEGYGLPRGKRSEIRRDQRAFIDAWVQLLCEASPGVDESGAEATVLGVTGLVNGYAWGGVRIEPEDERPLLRAMAFAALGAATDYLRTAAR